MAKKLLFLSGSIRNNSYNTLLNRLAAKIAQQQGAHVKVIDLIDYPMPLFNQDLEAEQGAPETVLKLKKKFKSADGFFIAAPEYNSSITPLLKNTLDWVSRKTEEDEPPLACFAGKAAAICAASPGGFGGLRGLDTLRLILAHIGVNVVGKQLAVAAAHQAFNEQDELNSEHHQQTLETVVKTLIRIA
jgi:NAD(P)H-dependent FMN reductase